MQQYSTVAAVKVTDVMDLARRRVSADDAENADSDTTISDFGPRNPRNPRMPCGGADPSRRTNAGQSRRPLLH